MLRDELRTSLKEAMVNKESDKISTLRLILAAIKDKDINARTTGNTEGISDNEILSLFQSMIKQRRDSIEMYTKGGREDLASSEQKEIEVIQSFMPKQLSSEEISTIIDSAITETGATGLRDMGKVMSLLKEKYAGQADFGQISAQIKTKLAG